MIRTKSISGIIIGVIILACTIITYVQLNVYEDEHVKSLKEEYEEVIHEIIERRETRIETITESFVGLFENAEINQDEFAEFSSRILRLNPDILNIVITENEKITYSFPNTEYTGNVFSELFPKHPVKMNGVNVMNIESSVNNEKKIIISLSYDYFIDESVLPYDNFKLILFSPVDNNIKLYEISNVGNSKKTNNVEFSNEELKSAIYINEITNLHGHSIKQNYVLKYIIYDSSFNKIDFYNNIFLIGGILSSIILPYFFMKVIHLKTKLNKYAKDIDEKNSELIQIENDRIKNIEKIKHHQNQAFQN